MDRLLDAWSRKMRRIAVPDLMKYICLGMLAVFILDYLPFTRRATELLYFNRQLILKGQVWRVVTFLFLPPSSSLLWILLSLYFYFFLGTALENQWGSARFTLYYLLGALGGMLAGFLMGYTTNSYVNMSLFLAFAMLYPDFQVNLFFVLPVKMKWLGWADAVLLLISFFRGNWAGKVSLLLSLLPFWLFFGKQLWLEGRMMVRHWLYRIRTR